jgi:hypothetical protein
MGYFGGSPRDGLVMARLSAIAPCNETSGRSEHEEY